MIAIYSLQIKNDVITFNITQCLNTLSHQMHTLSIQRLVPEVSAARLITSRSDPSSIRHGNQKLHQSASKSPSSNFTSTEALMLEEAGASLGGDTGVRHAIANFMKSAKELGMILEDGNEIHCFFT